MERLLLLSFLLILTERQFIWSQEKATETQPNIIFILTDDQRFDALAYQGNKLAHTPEMDRLAKEGVYFRKAMASTPICSASRATILTGLYERTHGYNFQTSGVKKEFMQNAYPQHLRKAGYYTGFYGKLGVRTDQQNDLFDVYDEYDRNNSFKDHRGYYYKTIDGDTVHLTRYTGYQALNFIDQAPKNQPFCLSLSFSAPHAHDPAQDQYFWQEESEKILKKTNIPEPALVEDKYFEALPREVREGFNRTRWHWRYDTPEKYQHSVKGYYRMIADIDREIAKIRAKLEEKGLADNTIIILMGDNGYFMGERQLAGKWLMYDNSIRVPLIIYDPRKQQHRDIDELVLNVDIPPTILDFAGISPPESWQGKSLLPLVQGNTGFERKAALIEHLWEFDKIPPSEGIRTAEWKYLRYVNDKSLEELYHLKEDPSETKNLAGDKLYQTKLEEMRQTLREESYRFRDKSFSKPDGLSIELIREPANLKIIDQQPEYSWKVPSGAKQQLAYQILVASSQEKIEQNIGDVWNSGQVRSEKSFNIPHEGKALQNGEKYYWKVRIWGELNRLSPYSDPQSFTCDGGGKQITSANLFQSDSIKPKVFEKKAEGYYFADFGKDAFATLEIDYTTEEPDTLTIRVGEQLVAGKINQKPMGHIRFQEVKLPVFPGKKTYQLPIKADVRNTQPNKAVALPDSFPVLMPFRYCEIEGNKQLISANDLRQLTFYSYFDESQSSFSSSDTVLNQVWDLCKYSIKATSFAGVYVDGDRERIPYEADAYINQLSHYAVDAEYPIARRTIEYFMEKPTWPTEWQQHLALMVYADYKYTGNKELIEKYYEVLKHKSLMDLRNEEGLITSTKVGLDFMKKLGFQDSTIKLRDIVDWPPAGWGGDPNVKGERDGFVFMPYNTVVNAFFYKNMKIMSEFAEILGKSEDALDFELMALQAKKALNKNMFDKSRGIYVDGIGTDHASLHANMMPLAFGMVDKEHIPSVVAFIKSRGMACSVYAAQYLMDALYNVGEGDYALKLMTATHDRSWWNMIAVGSTITLEAWDMKYKPNADWNHAWGSVPGNIIARRMWGIQPKTPGAALIYLEPQLGSLSASEIEVPFLTGIVKASYQKVSNIYEKYEIELPANVSGDLILKYDKNQSIELNGETVNAAFESIHLSPGKNLIELNVNSF